VEGYEEQVVRGVGAGGAVLEGCQWCCCQRQGVVAAAAGEVVKGGGEEVDVGVLHNNATNRTRTSQPSA
jgi:hypothetical protein